MRIAQESFPGWWAARPICIRPTKTRLKFDGAGDFEAGKLRRPQFALWRSRTRHGRDRQWHGAFEAAARSAQPSSIFSDYMQPPIRLAALMEIPVIYDLHPRFHRPGRRRPHPSTDRATGFAACHAGADDCSVPRDANEVVEAWKIIMQLKHEPARAGPDAPGPCLPSIARNMRPRRAWLRAATFLPTLPTASRK